MKISSNACSVATRLSKRIESNRILTLNRFHLSDLSCDYLTCFNLFEFIKPSFTDIKFSIRDFQLLFQLGNFIRSEIESPVCTKKTGIVKENDIIISHSQVRNQIRIFFVNIFINKAIWSPYPPVNECLRGFVYYRRTKTPTNGQSDLMWHLFYWLFGPFWSCFCQV